MLEDYGEYDGDWIGDDMGIWEIGIDTVPNKNVRDHKFRDESDEVWVDTQQGGIASLEPDTVPAKNVRDHRFRDSSDEVWADTQQGGITPLEPDTVLVKNVRDHRFREESDEQWRNTERGGRSGLLFDLERLFLCYNFLLIMAALRLERPRAGTPR